MVITYGLVFLFSLFVVIKSADMAIKYSSNVASSFRFSKYILGFLVVAAVSVLPELLVSVSSAIQGIPAFGLGTLFGSNVADLSLIIAIVVFFSKKGVKVESKILKDNLKYIFIILIPLFFGLNGYYARWEGVLLILSGLLFYILIFKKSTKKNKKVSYNFSYKNLFFLIISLLFLLVASNFTVKFGILLANGFKINPIIIGMFFVALGTTLPELFFSIKAVRNKAEGLALGDILGTVITDATIVLGITVVIMPFSFDARLIFVTGFFMLFAMILLFIFMKTERILTKREAFFLLLFYFVFVATEIFFRKL
ncbi:MAG: hypothetical protein PHN19_02520 [Patescibacteria group bacterium]|nr:hypothetical protein [Patescibacteria group bacterium]